MTRRVTTSTLLALAATLFVCTDADAQLFRAYLASTGSDTNPCTLTDPCRLLPAAITAVTNGGEIWMLDSANYNTGTVTITKSVSILAVPGSVGSLVVTNGGPAISITANLLKIFLRNVLIGPLASPSPGTKGIHMTGNSELVLQDSVITGLSFHAIHVVGTGTLNVNNVTIRNINNQSAIVLENGASGTVTNSRLIDAHAGLLAMSNVAGVTTTATMSDSVVTDMSNGVGATVTGAGMTSLVSVARSTIERSNTAILITANSGTAELDIGNSIVANNTSSWSVAGAGAVLYSFGNNQMRGNGTSSGAKTALAGQ